MSQQFNSFSEFYPFYLGEHQNQTCRRLHVVGLLLGIAIALMGVLVGNLWLLLALPLSGYAFAWVGHYFFEHNRPATFSHPVYSLMGDWVMLKDVLTGRIKF